VRERHHRESDQIICAQGPLPGVIDYIHEAKRLGLTLAIASSSDLAWVYRHSTRLGVLEYFDQIVTRDDVGVGRTKPNPDLFLTALSRLKVPKEAAIVFEDSPNGIKAAKRAGIFAVAVPNAATSALFFEGADLILKSLTDLSLAQLLDKVK
jgi:HAD superfamily hydrolase (TIGR01509 family)